MDLRLILHRRLTLTGSTLRPRSVEEKGALARELEANVWPLLESGKVRPVLAETLPLEQAAEAHRLLEAGRVIGKIVLARCVDGRATCGRAYSLTCYVLTCLRARVPDRLRRSGLR